MLSICSAVFRSGSLNGTYVNRQLLDAAKLVDGDEVQLRNFRLVFLSGGPHTPR